MNTGEYKLAIRKNALLAILVLIGLVAFLVTGCANEMPMTTPTTEILIEMGAMPWEKEGAKQPEDYTWMDFEMLTGEEQLAFQKTFAENDFEKWMEKVQILDKGRMPWEVAGAKETVDYTWVDFSALSAEQQLAFQKTFEDNGFEVWLEAVKPQEAELPAETVEYPWEKYGARKPENYTWAHFMALTPEQQLVFPNAFASMEAYEQWENRENPDKKILNQKYPWLSGGKAASNYTWNDFQKLTPEQQLAFPSAFKDAEAFESWMSSVMPKDSVPWEIAGAKQPEEYTWEEFEALSPEQQMMFQSAFDNNDMFVNWYKKNVP